MMKKTDQKKQSIVDAAIELFRDQGFEKTSMVEINVKAGCSKRTLYSYFSSKEELFIESISKLAESQMEDIFSSLRKPRASIRTALLGYGVNMLQLNCSPETVAIHRLIVAEAERSDIGKLLYEKISSSQEEITTFLAKAMDDGKLRHDDPVLATVQLRSLLQAEVFGPCMLGVCQTPLKEKTVRTAAVRAVSTFLRAYAPN